MNYLITFTNEAYGARHFVVYVSEDECKFNVAERLLDVLKANSSGGAYDNIDMSIDSI